jgi:FlaA1/EpsC-like NDP-sugar epimerase
MIRRRINRHVRKLVTKVINRISELDNRHFLAIDIIIFLITPLLALEIRLDGFANVKPYLFGLLIAALVSVCIKQIVLQGFNFYRRCWRYASIEEVVYTASLIIAIIALQTLVNEIFRNSVDLTQYSLPRSVPLIDGMLTLLLIGGTRFSVRASKKINSRTFKRLNRRCRNLNLKNRILIVGAGSAGASLAREMRENSAMKLHPVAFIDDDPQKLNLYISGLPVVGNRHQIPEVVRSLNIDRIVIAIPSAPGPVIRRIAEIARQTGAQTSTLPGIAEILDGKVQALALRDIQIEDLLRRAPIQTNGVEISKFLRGKRVLITGAGGSIGSELCRQIFNCCPAEMILIGKGENSIFNIQQELELLSKRVENPEQSFLPQITAIIADIRSRSRLEYAFSQHKPEVVFHAAAHKHVPLMELNAPEAITSNVLGSKNLVELSLQYNVGHFVMISTDKAVNPTNIMGATKRTAEMLVLQAAKSSGKPYVVVRFGNVLGSRGSVVPTFKQQISAGGPVTVTHPDICRYFMTIPEAVQLVLQAAVLSYGGEVCMLDMGKPVKIVDLAKDMIRLSGYEIEKDIDIAFTGLRPGEKLYEELFIPGEQYEQTKHEKILIVRNASNYIPEKLNSVVEELCEAAIKNHSKLIVFLLEQIVPEYHPNYSINGLSAASLHENPKVIETQSISLIRKST